MYLVGNKSDEASRRCVTYDEAAAWAKDEVRPVIRTVDEPRLMSKVEPMSSPTHPPTDIFCHASQGLTYVETSAKADEAIDAMFNGMATDLHSVYREAGGNYDKLSDGGRVDVGGGSSGGNGTRSCCTIL